MAVQQNRELQINDRTLTEHHTPTFRSSNELLQQFPHNNSADSSLEHSGDALNFSSKLDFFSSDPVHHMVVPDHAAQKHPPAQFPGDAPSPFPGKVPSPFPGDPPFALPPEPPPPPPTGGGTGGGGFTGGPPTGPE